MGVRRLRPKPRQQQEEPKSTTNTRSILFRGGLVILSMIFLVIQLRLFWFANVSHKQHVQHHDNSNNRTMGAIAARTRANDQFTHNRGMAAVLETSNIRSSPMVQENNKGISAVTSSLPLEPVSCIDYKADSDPNNGMMESPKKFIEKLEPFPFWISLHKEYFDSLRWAAIMNRGEYYETGLTRQFHDILYDKPPGLVIDVGMNIGWFTLYSRAMGHSVIGFDPNPIMHSRVCESLKLNQWNKGNKPPAVIQYAYGLGTEPGQLKLTMGKNPGASSFHEDRLAPKWRKYIIVPVTTLDNLATQHGWLDDSSSTFTPIHLLKVDVEGYEPQVFQGARRLIGSRKIQNIIMENSSTNLDLIVEMFTFLAQSGYWMHLISDVNGNPYQEHVTEPTNAILHPPHKDVAEVRKALQFFAERSCNIWWKQQQQQDQLLQEPATTNDARDATTAVTVSSYSTNELVPVSCKDHNAESDPNNGMLESPKKFIEKLEPFPFWISLHKEYFDSMRWAAIMNRGEYYETGLTRQFYGILHDKPPGLVIDVGMNIGWFTLYSRAMGHQVIGFDPNPIMHSRVCESLQLNTWNDQTPPPVIQYAYGLGTEPGQLKLTMGKNPGASSFHEDRLAPKWRKYISVPVTTLDTLAIQHGWISSSSFETSVLSLTTTIHLLKVDVEGYEPQVFQGAKRLIGSRKVQNIIMENSSIDLELIIEMFTMLAKAGYWMHLISDVNGNAISEHLMEPTNKALHSSAANDGTNLRQALQFFAERSCNIWWQQRQDV